MTISRSVAGGAADTVLAAPITAGSPVAGGTLTLAAGTGSGYPSANFVLKINAGQLTMEKILISSRSGDVCTVATAGRGFDGTTAADHTVLEVVQHELDAAVVTAIIAHVNDTGDDHLQYVPVSTGAGAGLSIASRVMAVNVDNATLEISADTVREKDGGTTLAKLANLANATVIGRNTAGTGVPEAVTMAQLRTLAALVPGTNVQAWDADLDAIAALTSAANKMPYATGPGLWSLADLSVFARTLLDDADAATMRTTLGLGGLAILSTVGAAEITDGSVGQAEMNKSDFVSTSGDPLILVQSAYQTSEPITITTQGTPPATPQSLTETLVTMSCTRAGQVFLVLPGYDVTYTASASAGLAVLGVSVDNSNTLETPKGIGYVNISGASARVTLNPGFLVKTGLSVASHTFRIKAYKEVTGDTLQTHSGQTGLVVIRFG